jgi:type III pantothenate kinase
VASGPTPSGGGILAVDVSNTHTALAWWQGEVAIRHWQLATERGRTPDELMLMLAQLLALAGLDRANVAGCVLGSVVPDLVQPMSAACTALFGAPPLVVGPGVSTGLVIHTDDPREVGADRVANAVSAMARFGAPVVVLDFATALTVDLVGADGGYRGAVIAPGLEVAAEALAQRTARLPRARLEPPPNVIATDTEHGLQSGLFFGYLGLVEGLVARAKEALGPAPVVATGEAPWLANLLAHTHVIDAYEPLLTLDGLRRIHERQTAGPQRERARPSNAAGTVDVNPGTEEGSP